MIDGGLRALFRDNIPPPAHWQSIETGMTGRGIPDSNVCLNGHERWIEYKVTKGYAVPLRPEQVGWLLTRERHGGVTFIAVRRQAPRGARREPADELWVYRGSVARELKELGLNGPAPLLCNTGGPANWDWARLREVLVDGA